MVYSRVISEVDDWKFQQELNKALEEETSRGNQIIDILFSTCPAALSPFADPDQADVHSVTRYNAILFIQHTN